ncbi:ATP-dependent RNA helicase DDX19B [Trichinella spiralis]|uniref:ATP-dependent RNA helicase DDX19B n=1 Tax=Trichinella spiralis TaxID=6334 RepID=UPI0001EFC847|nr:ATP-dependent RNA helicase DDX19B [Trichinella spiralis]
MASAVFVILLAFLAFYPADAHSLSEASLDTKLLEDCMTKDHLEQYLNKPEVNLFAKLTKCLESR